MWAFDGDRVTVAQKYKASLLEHKDNATQMIECFINYASHYKTKHVLFTLGSDFTFVVENTLISTAKSFKVVSATGTGDDSFGAPELVAEPQLD